MTVTVDEAREAAATKRAAAAILRRLNKTPGQWVSGTDLRRALTGETRSRLHEALDALVVVSQIEVEHIEYRGLPGMRVRSVS